MIEKYEKLCDKIEKVSDDNELSHIIQDKIYRKFINDITNQKIKGAELLQIAKLLKKKVIKYDKNRWYA
jgi:translation initiation factor 1 (eIF-1/SUI1)